MDPLQHSSNIPKDPKKHIYSVSRFTAEIKDILENKYPFIWIKGEVSNFKQAVSGHYYFTLKDDQSQISAVMFRNQSRQLKFKPEDGLMLVGFGRLSVYEPRGTYQVIFEYLEPDGKGALVAAFEQLKTKLAEEGLFDEKFKKPLPFLPKKISIITSSTGAVIHDLIHVITRRFPSVHIEIVPAKVQGDGAEEEIISDLKVLFSRYASTDAADVIILARGGGSLEDMHAFNSEKVARAIFESPIPVISAIGHETDYTIADFVSDFRAPTPSAAGEIVIPVKADLTKKCGDQLQYLFRAFLSYLNSLKDRFAHVSKRLFYQERKITDLRLRVEDMFSRLNRMMRFRIRSHRDALTVQSNILYKYDPVVKVKALKEKLEQTYTNLLYFNKKIIDQKKYDYRTTVSMLSALNPIAILDRGYSITRTIDGQSVIRDASTVVKDQELEVILAKGKLTVRTLLDKI